MVAGDNIQLTFSGKTGRMASMTVDGAQWKDISQRFYMYHSGSVGCAFFTLDSAVLGFGLESSGCDCCMVRVFQLKFTIEDVIGSHACSLEALACV
jgi:hypothetical protein